MVNVHIRHFAPHSTVLDAEALEMFRAQWGVYRKLVEANQLYHREVGQILHDTLNERFGEPFAFLDIACGDASLMVTALAGTAVRHYHGIDTSSPALELAAANLEPMPFEVDLDERDFVAALESREEHADAVWCGLSIHHLHTAEKRDLFAAIREAVGPGGLFMLYEPTLADGEDRDGYLDRYGRILRANWTMLDPDELDAIHEHIRTCDLPEQAATWLDIGRDAGFPAGRQMFADRDDLFRMFAFEA